jgi:hypothetical protein
MTKSLKYCLVLATAVTAMVCGCRAISGRDAGRQDVPQMPATTVSASCFVRLYRTDGDYYLTRQNHDVAPAEEAIRISGREPDGSYVWQFVTDIFTPLEQPAAAPKWLPEGLAPVDYCRLVLAGFRAAMVGQSYSTAPVRIRGNWAYPVRSEHNLTWYQSREGAAVADIVTLDGSDGIRYVACGYGYYLARDAHVLVPARMEIFRVDASAGTEQMLLRLDYLN